MAENKDYYKILGVEKGASDDDIKSAYRRLAKKYHPDVNKEANSAEKFKEVNEAYGVLSDKQKRSNYDQFGSADGPNPNDFFRGGGGQGFGGNFDFDFGGFDDLFNIFGGFGGGNSRRTSQAVRGDDIQVKMNLTFSEAVLGCSKKITIPRVESCNHCSGTGAKGGTEFSTCSECAGAGQVRYTENSIFGRVVKTGICKSCSGTGKKIKEKCTHCSGNGYSKVQKTISVKIPAGIDNGRVITVRGGGNAGIRGGMDGDLHIIPSVASHKLLERDSYDLKLKVYVPFTTMLLGGEVEIPLVEGTTTIKIPELTQSNTILKLKGKGVKHLERNAYGDLIVTVVGESPKTLSKDEKELLSKLNKKLADGAFIRHKAYLKDLQSIKK